MTEFSAFRASPSIPSELVARLEVASYGSTDLDAAVCAERGGQPDAVSIGKATDGATG